MRDRLAKTSTGDLVRITGRVRQSSYDADGATRYTVDMIADGFAILAKASGNPCRVTIFKIWYYRKFATLISTDEAICAAARGDLHAGIAALSNPSLIDLVFNLGRIERSRDERMHAYCTLPDGNLKAAQQIAKGMKFVEDWPLSIKALGDEALNERATNRYKLDRLKRLPLHLKDDDLTVLLREAIPVVFLGRRTALVDGASPIMLGSHLKKLSGLTAAHIQSYA